MTPETGSNLSLDTARVILVPEEEWTGEEAGNGVESGIGEEFLRFGGMEPTAHEVVVESKPVNGIVAVMAVPAEEWEQYRDKYERGEVAVTSPLLDVATSGIGGGWGRKREVNMVLTPENVYLAVWEKDLKMAEALPDNSTDSILYYMQVVGRQFELRKFDINVSGPRAGLVADALRQYYKKVKVVMPTADSLRSVSDEKN